MFNQQLHQSKSRNGRFDFGGTQMSSGDRQRWRKIIDNVGRCDPTTQIIVKFNKTI